MKLFTFCIMFFLLAAFSSCENHMDIKDTVKGTPTNADTVLIHHFPPQKVEGAATVTDKSLPRVFKR